MADDRRRHRDERPVGHAQSPGVNVSRGEAVDARAAKAQPYNKLDCSNTRLQFRWLQHLLGVPTTYGHYLRHPAGVMRALTMLCALVLAQPAAAQSTREIRQLASRYVAAFEAQLIALVADERYEQRGVLTARGVTDVRSRTLESELGWTRVRVGETIAVREVRRIDGEPAGSDPRLRSLLERPPDDPDTEIRTLLAEGARHNLGPDGRNFNFPTFALVYLRAERAGRLSWRTTRRAGGIELHFTEPDRGTVVRSAAGRPVRARGRFLIDPEAGRVERAELSLRQVPHPSSPGGGSARLTCDLTVAFAEVPALGLWLPVSMDEHYEREHEGDRLVLKGKATYSNYRRYATGGRLLP